MYICTMNIKEAKQEFIQSWGALGSSWGVNKTMAQIHALLLVSPDALNADEIMEQLQASRGNVNMNVRALIDWGLVRKVVKQGDRKEYFFADKDIWEIAQQVARERRRRELDPIEKVLKRLQKVEGETKEVEQFKTVIKDIDDFRGNADSFLGRFIDAEQSWFSKLLLKLVKR